MITKIISTIVFGVMFCVSSGHAAKPVDGVQEEHKETVIDKFVNLLHSMKNDLQDDLVNDQSMVDARKKAKKNAGLPLLVQDLKKRALKQQAFIEQRAQELLLKYVVRLINEVDFFRNLKSQGAVEGIEEFATTFVDGSCTDDAAKVKIADALIMRSKEDEDFDEMIALLKRAKVCE